MKQTGLRAVALVMALASGCGLSGAEQLPEDVSAPRSRPLADDRVRVWPSSAQVEEGVEYVYETGHCGLTYELDFDGSFWEPAVEPGNEEPPSFFINQDEGTITLVSENEARYEGSTGETVELRRLHGPIVLPGCA